jgi:hypothetical protein
LKTTSSAKHLPNIGTPKFEVTATKTDALGGLATRKFIHISLPDRPAWQGMDVMLYIPERRQRPRPASCGLSFGGNHAVSHGNRCAAQHPLDA